MTKKLQNWTLEEMEDLFNELGSYRKCAKVANTTHGTWIRHYKEKKQIDKTCEKLTKYLPKEINTAIEKVQDSGYFVTKKPLKRGYNFDLDIETTENNIYKIGIVSDTHMGSRYQQLESLWKFYEKCDNEGITTIFHAGDLSDGVNIYNGQQHEIFLHGERAQAQYIIDNYPEISGMTTEIVGGNHDESFYKRYGSDICYDVAVQRPDIHYKGFYLANFNIDDINICLHHGDGGVAYARSYKPQKIALSKIEDKNTITPDIVALGHYHCSCILPDYIGIYMIQMPCFQAATPSYMGRKGLTPDIGGIILEFEESDGKLVSTKTQYVKYNPKDDDY